MFWLKVLFIAVIPSKQNVLFKGFIYLLLLSQADKMLCLNVPSYCCYPSRPNILVVKDFNSRNITF